MSEKKAIKRSVRAVWDKVKALRTERAKLYDASEIETSAEALTAHAAELRTFAKEMSALSAMPPLAAPAKRKQKRKAPANDAT